MRTQRSLLVVSGLMSLLCFAVIVGVAHGAGACREGNYYSNYCGDSNRSSQYQQAEQRYRAAYEAQQRAAQQRQQEEEQQRQLRNQRANQFMESQSRIIENYYDNKDREREADQD